MSDEFKKHMRFDRAFQHSVLRLMMLDHQFCHRSCEMLEPAHFIDRLSWFFTKIKDWYSEHGQMPTREVLSADIHSQPIAKQQEYYNDLDAITAIKPVPEKIKRSMTDFVRCNIFVEAATTAASQYNNGKRDEAFAYVRGKMEALYNADFEDDPFSRFGDAQSVMAQAEFEVKNAIKTGIHAIDDQIGGMSPGTFTVWLGASNAGKSMLGPVLSKQAAKIGKRTFVTVHEDEEVPTKIRYLACFSDIPISTLMYGGHSLTDDEKARLAEADRLLKEFVVLRFMYTTQATIENVMDVARGLMRDWPGNEETHPADGFDLFICDYGQCLTSTQYKSGEMRHLHEHIYHMLKQLCLELKVAGSGGAQVNRNGMAMNRAGSDWLRCTDVSEAYGIIKKATNVITINRSNDDMINDRIVFLLDKARNGKCPVAVECVSNFSKGVVFYSDKDQSTLQAAEGPAKKEVDEFGPSVSKQTFG